MCVLKKYNLAANDAGRSIRTLQNELGVLVQLGEHPSIVSP